MRDEDPTPQDIARFSAETAYCPECGAEIWDQADVCPKCYSYLDGATSARPPIQKWFNKRMTIVIAVILILVLVGLLI